MMLTGLREARPDLNLDSYPTPAGRQTLDVIGSLCDSGITSELRKLGTRWFDILLSSSLDTEQFRRAVTEYMEVPLAARFAAHGVDFPAHSNRSIRCGGEDTVDEIVHGSVHLRVEVGMFVVADDGVGQSCRIVHGQNGIRGHPPRLRACAHSTCAPGPGVLDSINGRSSVRSIVIAPSGSPAPGGAASHIR
ncbi:hypothetical protein [Nocardia sp. NPDC127526]|uniref:hypothetical protein n=1 Tax=Nocardia sp. NPDC127526 TaxID=3345393 RepID=UPI0036314497